MPDGVVERVLIMISEIFLLAGVRKHHRSLWIWSWLFHISLYLLIGIAGLSIIVSVLGNPRDSMTSLIAALSFPAYACGIVGTSGLMIMRVASPKLRPLSSFSDLFNLALLFAIFFSGLLHVLIQPAAASILVAQTASLLWLNPAPALHPVAFVHLCLIALFMSYMPFTQMAHMALKYFTYHSVRWDNRATCQIPGYADRMRKYLAYPVSWSASHIRTGKTIASWADVVTANGAKEQKLERH